MPSLQFDDITPLAPRGLGGLVRDHFANGRIFATVGSHGGLLDVAYWCRQHLGAPRFFRGEPHSAWTKLMRVCVRIGARRYYLTLNHTRLLPFGYTSRCTVAGVEFEHDLLLLSDALVQRARIVKNPRKLAVGFELMHQEAATAVTQHNRTWAEMEFDPQHNALVTSCEDVNPPRPALSPEEESLAQRGLKLRHHDSPQETTWMAIGCDATLSARRGHHRRSKHYLKSETVTGNRVAYFLAFAPQKRALHARLAELQEHVHESCDELLAGYHQRLQSRPRIDVGDPVLNSAFGQFPEIMDVVKIPDQPGAMRATVSGYFVWGWDNLTAPNPMALANDAASTANTLRFLHRKRDPIVGIPHQFTSTFRTSLKSPFSAQSQFIACLYHYVACTGDLKLAKEVWSTCQAILRESKKLEVGDTGLVSGPALWPDFPEAMEEDGNDISSLNNSLLYQGLRAMEYLAHTLGQARAAQGYGAWAARLRKNFVRYLFDDEKGFFLSSCSSRDFQPRKHYPPQAVLWLTPFARELVSHAPQRIADFMHEHLRSDKCLLTLPQWDTAWMADGNQLGSSFPIADYFYLHVHKLVGAERALKSWQGDVRWFWQHHTAPEAFTPEAENEAELGPDNPGCKQLQAVSSWYACASQAVAGLDVDHEGLTFTPWGSQPVTIDGLKLRHAVLDIRIRGRGSFLRTLRLNGKVLSPASHKISWRDLRKGSNTIEITRTTQGPKHPVIVRADGLSLENVRVTGRQLTAKISAQMTGELMVRAKATARVLIDGESASASFDAATSQWTITVNRGAAVELRVSQA